MFSRADRSSAPSGSVAASRGIPDVPHATNIVTVECTEGSGVGFKKEPPVLSEVSIAEVLTGKQEGALLGEVDLSFLCELAEGLDARWQARLVPGNRLLLQVPDGALPEGSKECFVRVLEYAEERLNCKEVLVEFDKERKDRPLLIRTFMYFGFAMLPPDKAAQLIGPNRMAMVYKI